MRLTEDEVISYAVHKIKRTADKIGSKFPYFTEGGRWKTTANGSWTGGFWVGLLWLGYLATENKEFLDLAWKWLPLLERRKNDKTFDLGFLFYPSFALGYTITNNGSLKKIALEAADTLAGLAHTKSGFICQEISWGGKKFGRAAIDAMMDLPLLWWAYDETKNKIYYRRAYKHSKKTLESLIKNDRPAIHAVDLDLKTGEIVRKLTLHGYRFDSRWSRGQAWCIYGFTLAYGATKERVFLHAAERLADLFIKDLPADHVPYWDSDDPNIPNAVKDSSAAAIACSGLITLHKLCGKQRFGEIADRILHSLCTNYVAKEDEDGILAHGCFDFPKRIGVDESLIWGDFFFLEAILKLKTKGFKINLLRFCPQT